jgi:hypothetical protein
VPVLSTEPTDVESAPSVSPFPTRGPHATSPNDPTTTARQRMHEG